MRFWTGIGTTTSHFPSGDQVICWKNPLRGSVRKTCRVVRSTNATPLMDKLASWSPSGLKLAQGNSPGLPSTTSKLPSALARTSSPCSPWRLLSMVSSRRDAPIEQFATIPRELGRMLVEPRGARQGPELSAVGPAEKEIPIPRAGPGAKGNPAFAVDFGLQSGHSRIRRRAGRAGSALEEKSANAAIDR